MKKKPRPVVIISRDEINGGNCVTVVPFYSQQLERRRELDFCVFFYAGESGLEKDCVAKCDEISKVDKTAINLSAGPIGSFNESQMERLMGAVAWSIGLED